MSAKKRMRLMNLSVDKVDAVGNGDNPPARAVMWKAAPTMDCPKCGKKMPMGGKCPECGYKAKSAPARKDLGTPPTCTEILDTRAQADALQQLQYAFTDAMYGILYGGGDSKVELMRKNVEAFGARLNEITGKPAAVAAMKSFSDEEPEAFVERASEWIDEAISKARETMTKNAATLDVNAIPEAQRPAVEALQKSVTDTAAALATITTERDTLKARVSTLDAAPEDEFAGVPETTKARFIKERETNKAAAERIEKLEETNAINARVSKVRTEHSTMLNTTPDDFGAMLYRMEKGKTTPADAIEFERIYKATVAQAVAGGGVTKETGTASGDDEATEDPTAALLKRAEEMVKKGEAKSVDAATDHILATDADMRARMSHRPGPSGN